MKTSEKNVSFSAKSNAEADLAKLREDFKQFFYHLSHDLNSPIRATVGFADIFENRIAPKLNDEEMQIFKHMKSSQLKIQSMVEDLLRFYRTFSKEPKMQAIPIKELIGESRIRETYQFDFDIEIQYEGDFDVHIEMDLDLMQKLIHEIIDNAFKNRKEKGTLLLTFRGEQTSEHCYELSIEDDGIGFDQKHAEKALELFQKLSNHDRNSGNGAGLAIANKIAEIHKAELSINSELNKGTTVSLTLCHDR